MQIHKKVADCAAAVEELIFDYPDRWLSRPTPLMIRSLAFPKLLLGLRSSAQREMK